MSEARTIRFRVAAPPAEQAIAARACEMLRDALKVASGEDWATEISVAPNAAALLDHPSDGAITLASLIPELDALETQWPEAEATLRATYETFSAAGDPVFICTMLRHVPPTEEDAQPRLLRLRRLNLLAAELSREFGCFVIDLDRILADLGGRQLQTDYRLGGDVVVDHAANSIAICVAANALDAVASFEVQDAARAYLEANKPATSLATDIKLSDVVAMGQGRRRQMAATVTDTVQENHVGWLVRQALNGRIGPTEALHRLNQAIRNRGAKESIVLLAQGISRIFRQRQPQR
jgi:hypothetical protein